jgi:hypothetical protein
VPAGKHNPILNTMASKRRRASSTVAVSDIQECFESFMESQKSCDLDKLVVKTLKVCTWKTSAGNDMSNILSLHSLYKELLLKAPNGVLPPAATRKAVESCNIDGLANFSKKPSGVFADEVSQAVRVGLSKLRECKDSTKTLEVTLRKLAASESKRLHELLSLLKDAAEEEEEGRPQGQELNKNKMEFDDDGFSHLQSQDDDLSLVIYN